MNVAGSGLILQGGGTPRGTGGGGAAPPESQDGGTEGGQPEAISQPVDPSGVGGLSYSLYGNSYIVVA